MKKFTLILNSAGGVRVRRVLAQSADDCYSYFNFRGNLIRCELVFEGFPPMGGEENLDFNSQQRLEAVRLTDIDPQGDYCVD